MTQEVGSLCSTPLLFFQALWVFSFFFSEIHLFTAITYLVRKKQHRNALIYIVADQKRAC